MPLRKSTIFSSGISSPIITLLTKVCDPVVVLTTTEPVAIIFFTPIVDVNSIFALLLTYHSKLKVVVPLGENKLVDIEITPLPLAHCSLSQA